MSKIRDNLRLILNIKDLEDKIKSLENKATIPFVRSTASQVGALGNSVSTGASGAGNVNSNGGATGNGDSHANPTGNSVKDAASLFDSPKIGDRLDQLKNIHNCGTGNELALSPNGLYTAPPDWVTGDQKYATSTFSAGFKWTWNGGTSYFATAEAAGVDRVAADNNGAGGTIIGNHYEFVSIEIDGNGVYNVKEVQTMSGGHALPSTQPPFLVQLDQQACVVGTTMCPATKPSDGDWPSGQPTQLAFKDGRLQTNPNQVDADNQYKDGLQSSTSFCFGPGLTRHGTFTPANDGGSLLYETDGSGTAIKDAMHYTADGVLDRMVNKDAIDDFMVT